MPISIQQISYIHPDKEVLFSGLTFSISKGQKLGLVGNNGCGKSTLLQIIAGQLLPSSGTIVRPSDLYYTPQHFGQYDSLTIAQAIEIERKQKALHAILNGDASNENFAFCCLMISNNTPDLFILDEPTNNLDIQSIEIITKTMKNYAGTVIAISHDNYFTKEIGTDQRILLS